MDTLDTLRLPAAPTLPLITNSLGEAPTVVMPSLGHSNLTMPGSETAPITFVDSASSPAVPLPRRNRLDLGTEPVRMTDLGDLGRKGQSNYDPSPDRTALVKYVASLGIAELDALASGDKSGVPNHLLENVSSTTITDAMTYAGKLAGTLREQHDRSSSQEPSRRPATSGLNNLMQGTQAGRKAAALVAEDFAQAASTPLPAREPGKILREKILPEVESTLQRKWGAGRIRGEYNLMEPPADRIYNGYPAEAVNDPYRSTSTHDDGETQIIARLHHRTDNNTAKLPEVNVGKDGSVTTTRREAKEQERRGFSFRVAIAAGAAVVTRLVSRGQHRAPASYQGQRRSLALNN